MTPQSTTWEAVTAAGVTVKTFGDEDLARDWVADRKGEPLGAYVDEVTTTVTRRRVYKPRLKVVAA